MKNFFCTYRFPEPLCLCAHAPFSRFPPFTDKFTPLAEFIRSLTDKTMKTKKVLSFL